MSKKKKKKIKLSPAREEMLQRFALQDEIRELRRSPVERWFDRHNHKMEFMRTLFGLATIGLQVVILLKIFNHI